MAEPRPNGVLVSPWNEERASATGVRHFCGEAHVQVYVSRYLSSPELISPRKTVELNAREKELTSVQSHLVSKVMQHDGELTAEQDEIFDLLAAAEAALKGKVTVDSLDGEWFDA
jgi:hypothetical protein